MKKLLFLSSLLTAFALQAETFTWTGDAQNNDVTDPANWMVGGEPATQAPIAGADERQFVNGELSVSGNIDIYNTDSFNKFKLIVGNEMNLWGNISLVDSTITTVTIIRKQPAGEGDGFNGKPVISLNGSTLKTTRENQRIGFYAPYAYENSINLVSSDNKQSYFIYNVASLASVTGQDDTAYDELFKNQNIAVDLTKVEKTAWYEKFSMTQTDGFMSVCYCPLGIQNQIITTVSDVTASSAVLTARIIAQEEGTFVKFACGTTLPTEEQILSSDSLEVNEGVASITLSSLTDMTEYLYCFAVVSSDGTTVLSSKYGTFLACDYTYVWQDGAWVGKKPENMETSDSILFLSPYDNGVANFNPDNKTLWKTSLRTGTLSGAGTLRVYSSQVANVKLNDPGAVYGFWNVQSPLDFITLSADGIIYPACSYTFNAIEVWKTGYVAGLLENGRILVNGKQVTDTAAFVLTENVDKANEGTTPINLTITYFEPFPANASGNWTVKDGARVRLTGNVSVDALAIEFSDVVIDLNGYKLKAGSLTVGGTAKKGTFTSESEDLGFTLKGDGSLVAGQRGMVIVIR